MPRIPTVFSIQPQNASTNQDFFSTLLAGIDVVGTHPDRDVVDYTATVVPSQDTSATFDLELPAGVSPEAGRSTDLLFSTTPWMLFRPVIYPQPIQTYCVPPSGRLPVNQPVPAVLRSGCSYQLVFRVSVPAGFGPVHSRLVIREASTESSMDAPTYVADEHPSRGGSFLFPSCQDIYFGQVLRPCPFPGTSDVSSKRLEPGMFASLIYPGGQGSIRVGTTDGTPVQVAVYRLRASPDPASHIDVAQARRDALLALGVPVSQVSPKDTKAAVIPVAPPQYPTDGGAFSCGGTIVCPPGQPVPPQAMREAVPGGGGAYCYYGSRGTCRRTDRLGSLAQYREGVNLKIEPTGTFSSAVLLVSPTAPGAHTVVVQLDGARSVAASDTAPVIDRSQECPAVGAPGGSPSSWHDPAPTTTETLYIVNDNLMCTRFGARYGALRSELVHLSDSDPMKVAIRSVEDESIWPGVGDRPTAHLAAVPDGVKQIVLVGSIDGLPGGSLNDVAIEVAPESKFEGLRDLAAAAGQSIQSGVGNGDTYAPGVSAAVIGDPDIRGLASGDLSIGSTDDSYTIPTAAVGRLVETPEEIVAQLRDWENSANPIAGSTSSVVAGYDFLTDSSLTIAAKLAAAGPTDASLIREDWTASELVDHWLDADPAVGTAVVNAHFDQYRLLSASGNTGSAANSLVTTGDIAARTSLAGSLVVTVGCHAAFSMPDWVYGDADRRSLDWPQAMARAGVRAFVGAGGYGYGDTDVAAYSERLEELFVQALQTQETIGEALLMAKRLYVAEHPTMSPYDLKALQDFVLFGLPMWKTPGAHPKSGADLPARLSVSSQSRVGTDQPVKGLTTGLRQASVSYLPALSRDGAGHEQIVTPLGSYLSGSDGDISVVPGRPVLPVGSMRIATPPGMVAHGVVIDSMLTTRARNVDPLVDQPTMTSRSGGAEPNASGVSPLVPAQLTRSISGQRVQVIPARFRPDATGTRGDLDVTRWAGARVLFAPTTSTDFTAPQVHVELVTDRNRTRVVVSAGDDGPLWSVRLLHRTFLGIWVSSEQRINGLSSVSGVSLSAPSSPGGSFDGIVQVIDVSGNVGVANLSR